MMKNELGPPSGRLVALSALAIVLLVVGTTQSQARKSNRECQRLRRPHYDFYGTKTLYKKAVEAIDEASSKDSEEDDDEAKKEAGKKLPTAFSNKTMRDVHGELEHHGCEPVLLYFIGRHGARYGDAEDIEVRNKLAERLQRHVEQLNTLSKSSSDSSVSSSSSSSSSSDSSTSSQQSGNNTNACLARRLAGIRLWRATQSAEQDNLHTKTGADEQRDLGERLRVLFPDLLDGRKSNIEVKTTEKLRTVQAATSFLQKGVTHLDTQKLLSTGSNKTERGQTARQRSRTAKKCSLDRLPTDDSSNRDYSVDSIRNDTCYRFFTDSFKTDLLSFHDACTKLAGKKAKKQKNPDAQLLKGPKIMGPITERVNQRLGLNRRGSGSSTASSRGSADQLDQLKQNEVLELYDMCKFEQADGVEDSVWCSLFTRDELTLLEYVEDTDDYLNDAHALEHNSKIACPMVRDIVDKLSKVAKPKADDDEDADEKRRNAYLYFTHAGATKRLITALGLFQDDESYTHDAIERVLEDPSQVPKNRQWRSSLVSPFSGNVALIVYDCPKVHPKTPKNRGHHGGSGSHSHSHGHAIVSSNVEHSRQKREHPSGLKLVGTVTERPVKLPGCDGTVCPLDQFISHHKSTASECDIERVCGLKR